ncbi:MAG: type II toxin-antitoxin system VapC family toxin [Solirubrobacteraceae bacterium]
MPVVDASVVVDWIAPGSDPLSPSARALDRLAREDAEVLAPRLLLEEVANGLLTGIRRQRWSGASADASYALLLDLPVHLVDERRDLERAWDLSRRHDNHPVYDMLYVALAERRRMELVTVDRRLRRRLSTTPWIVGPEEIAH